MGSRCKHVYAGSTRQKKVVMDHACGHTHICYSCRADHPTRDCPIVISGSSQPQQQSQGLSGYGGGSARMSASVGDRDYSKAGAQSYDSRTVALKHKWVTPSTEPGFTFHEESPVQVWEGGKRGSTLDVTLLDGD